MSRIWDWLRMTRSAPGGLARKDPDRASVYRAALQQFEELIRAAEASGPASKPLPLFYALTQAGRAIVALRGGPSHRGHGLRIGELQVDALDTNVGPAPRGKMPGHFQATARALSSPTLGCDTQIGALIASLPEMADTLLMHEDWPPALAIFERDWAHGVAAPGWIPVTIVIDEKNLSYDRLVEVLEPYPMVQGKIGLPEAVKALGSIPTYPTPDGAGVGVLLSGGRKALDIVAPEYRISHRRWLRPAIAGAEGPDPTMTWWALLYALSMYARYHPKEWVAALDIDSSVIGVTLERTMNRAVSALPQLVLSAVLDTPFLLPTVEGSGLDPFGRGTI
jgi:hypothetical protein